MYYQIILIIYSQILIKTVYCSLSHSKFNHYLKKHTKVHLSFKQYLYNCFQRQMNLRAQWILRQQDIQEFQKQRQEHYRQFQYQTGRDSIFLQGILTKFVYFMRRRRRQHETLFKFQKIIYYAVALYKRYYLVNSFVCEDLTHSQALICCIYLSLKYNEYDDSFMLKAANKWQKHKYFTANKTTLPHFGQDGYSGEELKFLSGIKFQTGLSKVITPLEAMYHYVNSGAGLENMLEMPIHGQNMEDKNNLCPAIEKYLNRLYQHPTAMFLFQGPKIALSIMVVILRSKKLSLELLGKPFVAIYATNKQEIEHIVTTIEQEEQKGSFEQESKRITKIQGFKKPLQKPLQSPRFQPQRTSSLIFDKQ